MHYIGAYTPPVPNAAIIWSQQSRCNMEVWLLAQPRTFRSADQPPYTHMPVWTCRRTLIAYEPSSGTPAPNQDCHRSLLPCHNLPQRAEMKFKKIHLRCECGRLASRIREVGLTPSHELVFHWWCAGCKRQIFSVKSLSDYWRECSTRGRGEAVADVGAVTASDNQFLHSLGVRFLEEVDT